MDKKQEPIHIDGNQELAFIKKELSGVDAKDIYLVLEEYYANAVKIPNPEIQYASIAIKLNMCSELVKKIFKAQLNFFEEIGLIIRSSS